jgi:hypothetical protein
VLRRSKEEGLALGKRSKSKRFVAEGVKSVQKHDERIPYRERFSDAERKQKEADQHTLGGI